MSIKNCTVPRSHRSAALALITLCGLAASASAQCDAYRPGTYDFDQKRTTAPGIPGLPFDGVGHCIPTSWADNLAYISKHGLPQITNFITPDWKDPSAYNQQTVLINDIGTLMGTTAGGTSTFGPGMQALIDQRAPGMFVVSGKGYLPGDPASPEDALEVMLSGGFAAVVRGTYQPEAVGSNIWVRGNGHIMALRHVYNACGSTPELGLRDPSTSDSTTEPSVPKVYEDTLQLQNHIFRRPVGTEARSVWVWPSSQTSTVFRALDCIEIVTPTFALGGSVVNGQEAGVHMIRPVNLTDPLGPIYPDPLPLPGGIIRAVHIDPSLAHFWVIRQTSTGQTFLTKVGAGTLQVHLQIELENTLVSSFQTSGGAFYYGVGRELKKLDLAGPNGPTITPGVLLPAIQKIAVADDSTPSTAIVIMEGGASGSSLIARVPLDGDPIGPVTPLPLGVQLDGECSGLTKVGTGTLILTSSNTPAIYLLSPTSTGAWTLQQTIPLPPGTHPRNLQLSDQGSILYTDNGVVVELEPNATGGFSPKINSMFAGAQVGSVFALARSRNPRPEFTDLAGDLRNNQPETNPGRIDCAADFNDDGNLDPDDLGDFITAYFTSPPGFIVDFNADGNIDPDDLGDYITAYFTGCR